MPLQERPMAYYLAIKRHSNLLKRLNKKWMSQKWKSQTSIKATLV